MNSNKHSREQADRCFWTDLYIVSLQVEKPPVLPAKVSFSITWGSRDVEGKHEI